MIPALIEQPVDSGSSSSLSSPPSSFDQKTHNSMDGLEMRGKDAHSGLANEPFNKGKERAAPSLVPESPVEGATNTAADHTNDAAETRIVFWSNGQESKDTPPYTASARFPAFKVNPRGAPCSNLEQEIERLTRELREKQFELGKARSMGSSNPPPAPPVASSSTGAPPRTSTQAQRTASSRSSRSSTPLCSVRVFQDWSWRDPGTKQRWKKTTSVLLTSPCDDSMDVSVVAEDGRPSELVEDEEEKEPELRGPDMHPRATGRSSPTFSSAPGVMSELWYGYDQALEAQEKAEKKVKEAEEHVDLLRAQVARLEKAADDALLAKEGVELELEELKERVASKIRRVEGRWESKYEEKCKEVERLEYNLKHGLYGAPGSAEGEVGGGNEGYRSDASFSSFVDVGSNSDAPASSTSDTLVSSDEDDGDTAADEMSYGGLTDDMDEDTEGEL
ncbi:hypothetical protein JCM8547_001902 [Rhodosporidiobolus lusitaniae]